MPWKYLYALLELYQATGDHGLLQMATGLADQMVASQERGLFPRDGRSFARIGDEVPLALLHLAATLLEQRQLLPQAVMDRQYLKVEMTGGRVYDYDAVYGDNNH